MSGSEIRLEQVLRIDRAAYPLGVFELRCVEANNATVPGALRFILDPSRP